MKRKITIVSTSQIISKMRSLVCTNYCVCHRKERHGSIQKLFYSLSKSGETTIYKYTIKYE